MAFRTIAKDTFFTDSPEIRIRQSKAVNPLVQTAVDEEQRNPNKGLEMNCFMRPASDEERDGHLARVQGMQRLNDFLRSVEALGKKAELSYHTKERRTWHVSNDHPCMMLATSDKWCMSQLGRKKLGRRKVENMIQASKRPAELTGDYMFAGQFCLYCNGEYDDKITVALGSLPPMPALADGSTRATRDCVWTRK